MKKVVFSLAVFGLLFLGSCSSDDAPVEKTIDNPVGKDEEPGKDDEEPGVQQMIVGKWIPNHVDVTMAGASIAAMDYPHQENCETDFLEFKADQEAIYGYHNDTCELNLQKETWVLVDDQLKFNLFGSDINVQVVTNSATELIIQGSGEQFAPLIPILMPEAADLPSNMLALATIQLSLKK